MCPEPQVIRPALKRRGGPAGDHRGQLHQLRPLHRCLQQGRFPFHYPIDSICKERLDGKPYSGASSSLLLTFAMTNWSPADTRATPVDGAQLSSRQSLRGDYAGSTRPRAPTCSSRRRIVRRYRARLHPAAAADSALGGRNYNITLNFNKCMDCHAWSKYKEAGATKVSSRRIFKDATGKRARRTSRRAATSARHATCRRPTRRRWSGTRSSPPPNSRPAK